MIPVLLVAGSAPAAADASTGERPVARAAAAPGPGVAVGAMNAWFSGQYRTGSRLYQLNGEPLRITGSVWPLPVGKKARITIYVDGARIRVARVAIRPSGKGGRFTMRTRVWRPGRLTATVNIAKTATDPAWSYRLSPAVRVYSPTAGFGRSGHSVGILHAMLRSAGYWAPRGDYYSSGTGKAVLAFRKVNSMARVEGPSRTIYRMLHHRQGSMGARRPDLGLHWEADLSRQVLGLFNGRRPIEVHVTSSGKPSTPTVLGTYRFYRKQSGTNSHGMVHSTFFHNGYAIHGYAELPTYNASHGCLRVWVPNAWHIYSLAHIGQWITVYP